MQPISWARLLARIYEIRPLTCPRYQGPIRLIAFLSDPASFRMIRAHLGQPANPPVLAPRARAPPEFEAAWAATPGLAFDQSPPRDPTAPPPNPGFSFDLTRH